MDKAERQRPTPPRKELGRQLRMYRERAGLSKTGVPGIAETKLSKIENARMPVVKAKDVWELCRIYRIENSTAVELIGLADQIAREDQYDKYTYAPGQYWLFLQRESQAKRLSSHDTNWLPALLQSEQYLDAIYERTPWNLMDTDAGAAKKVRLNWQNTFFERVAAKQTCGEFIIGEAALVTNVGSAMDLQHQHLKELSQRPGIRIWVTPFSAGVHPSLGAEYTSLEFEDPDDVPMVWQATIQTFRNLSRERDVDYFKFAFEETKRLSITIEEYYQ